MNLATAGRVLVLRAYETAARDGAIWTAQDRAWATRVAHEGGAADGEAFIVARAQAAWRRLAPRDPGLGQWLDRQPGAWAGWAMVVGLVLGLLADALGSGQRINLLNPPLWGLVLWNLLVYLVLALAWFRPGRSRSHPLRRRILAWLAPPAATGGGAAAARQAFGLSWAQTSLPWLQARAAAALHAGAAALALGMLVSMYLRGLVFDYRATWESTFLQADAVHAVLAQVLAPASAVSAIAVPDAVQIAALRAPQSASAAVWIHLYAVTLLLWVILPRGALALWQGWQTRRLSRQLPLDLSEPYFKALCLAQRSARPLVGVWPHGQAPSAPEALALREAVAAVWADGYELVIEPTCAFGQEDGVAPSETRRADLNLAWVDMTATPEAEQHGRWLQQLRAGGLTPVLWVQTQAFSQRFGHLPERQAQRRQAWAQFAQTQGLACVFGDATAAQALAAAVNS